MGEGTTILAPAFQHIGIKNSALTKAFGKIAPKCQHQKEQLCALQHGENNNISELRPGGSEPKKGTDGEIENGGNRETMESSSDATKRVHSGFTINLFHNKKHTFFVL